MAWDQTACKPGSVPPAFARRRGGHSSGPPVAGRFSRPTRMPSDQRRPCRPCGRRDIPIRSCYRRGLPCRPGRPVRGGLLPHPFTLAPQASRPERRFAFCGAIPGVAPGGRYPPPCRRGARTFLPLPLREKGDRPAVWSALRVTSPRPPVKPEASARAGRRRSGPRTRPSRNRSLSGSPPGRIRDARAGGRTGRCRASPWRQDDECPAARRRRR